MKIQAVILVLGLVATVWAVPNFRERRQAASTTAAPATGHCGNTTNGLVITLLIEVGNLLDNILLNVGNIKIKGLLGGNGDLLNLSGLLGQLRGLISTLLVGGSDDSTDSANEDLLGSLVDQLIGTVDNLLGAGTGTKWACNNSGGIVGGLLQSVVDTVQGLLTGVTSIDIPLLGPLLKLLLGLVGDLLALLI